MPIRGGAVPMSLNDAWSIQNHVGEKYALPSAKNGVGSTTPPHVILPKAICWSLPLPLGTPSLLLAPPNNFSDRLAPFLQLFPNCRFH